VLKVPDLVKSNDWVQLEKASGIRTNTFALEAMRQRCTDVALQCPDLEARGLPALRAKLRSTAPDAPRSATRTLRGCYWYLKRLVLGQAVLDLVGCLKRLLLVP
jgi:hypothetical protein